MAITWRVTGGAALVNLGGQLAHSDHAVFTQITREAATHPEVTEFILDFAAVAYLDSAGLGMLLLLRDRTAGKRVVLAHCIHGVKAVLKMANFDKLFEIH